MPTIEDSGDENTQPYYSLDLTGIPIMEYAKSSVPSVNDLRFLYRKIRRSAIAFSLRQKHQRGLRNIKYVGLSQSCDPEKKTLTLEVFRKVRCEPKVVVFTRVIQLYDHQAEYAVDFPDGEKLTVFQSDPRDPPITQIPMRWFSAIERYAE